MDLSNPTGYLAGLETGDVNVWVQGVSPDSNFTFAVVYTDPSGQQTARNEIHMDLAQWNFVGANGQLMESATSLPANLLLDAAQASDPSLVGDSAEFKVEVDGLPSSAVQTLTIASVDTSDQYNSDILADPAKTVTSRFGVMYHFDDSTMLTESGKALIRQNLGLDAVHNEGVAATTRTAGDKDTRRLGSDPHFRIDPVQNDITPDSPINTIVNPRAIVIISPCRRDEQQRGGLQGHRHRPGRPCLN